MGHVRIWGRPGGQPPGRPGGRGSSEGLVMTRATFSDHLQAYDRLWRSITVAVYLLLVLAFAAGPPLAQVLLEPWVGEPEAPQGRRVWGLVVSSLTPNQTLHLTTTALHFLGVQRLAGRRGRCASSSGGGRGGRRARRFGWG